MLAQNALERARSARISSRTRSVDGTRRDILDDVVIGV